MSAQRHGLSSSGSAFLGAVAASLPEAMAIIGLDGRFIEMNTACLDLIGARTIDDVPDRRPTSVISSRSVAEFRKHFEAAMKGEVETPPPCLLVQLNRLDGTTLDVECRLAPIKRPDGSVEAVVSTGRNVSHREEVLRATADGAAVLHAILATVPDAMVVIDEHGLITSFSAAAEKLFGYTEAEVMGRNVNIIMPSPYREAHDGYLERYLRTGEKRIIGIGRTIEGEKRDGTRFPMELSVGEAVTGEHRAFTGFIRDLTEKQATENQLRHLQAELVHATRLTAVGTLASALAHELNQPLSAIANYMAAARDLAGAGKGEEFAIIREALDEAANEAVRAGQIVRRLRDFVSKGEVSKRNLSLSKLIGDATTLGLVGAREKGVEWIIEIDENVGAVLADRVQIQQVMVNLMRNAIEAMEASKVKQLTIRARPMDTDWVEISVADTGHGILPEVAAQLFQPFASTKARGMGLGLSICRTIIESHGGALDVDTDSDGTVFRFTLQRASKEIEDGT